jgi:AcrR family transcriptional regulator
VTAPDRTAAILDATVLLVAEVGFDRLTMDAVAARARSSKATIYRRWPGKADLVAAALSRYGEHAPPVVDTGSLRGDLVEVLMRMRDALADLDGALVLGVISAMRSDAALADIVRGRLLTAKTAAVSEVVNRAITRKELPRNADAALAAEIAAAVVFTRLVVTGRPIDDDQAARLVDAVLLPVLTTPSA